MSQSGMPGELQEVDDHEAEQTTPTESGPLREIKRPAVQWKPSPSKKAKDTIASGLSDEDLWMLIRRFNRQIYHVKAVPDGPQLDLDLHRAEDEQFPPQKLRMTIERFYTSVIVGVSNIFNQIGRLRSWNEPLRTAAFSMYYFAACSLDLLIPAIFGTMALLILCPPLRPLLFPPPPTPQDKATGDMKKPEAGQPAFNDSITGAPERHKGEAAEQEANNLVNSVAAVAMESAAAKYGQSVAEEVPEDSASQNMLETSSVATEAQPEDAPSEDNTKKPMKKKVAHATDSTMRVISDISDTYEKLANLLSPTPPFHALTSRLSLAGTLIGLGLVTPFTSSYWIIKGSAFAIGFAFFGDPVFKSTIKFLDEKIPDWKKYMEWEVTLLTGVPTNAQLTLTLLRIGELNSEPLPAPPTQSDSEQTWPLRRRKTKALLDNEDNNSTTSLDLQRENSTESLPATKPKKRWVFRVLKFVRRTIATAIKGHIAFDRAMAIAGSAHTKNLISMLNQQRWIGGNPFGPLKFDAKFERKRGAAVLDTSKQPPILYFTTYQSAGLDDLRVESRKKGSVLFQIPVTDIQELKKTEGLGWKGKLIVELTAGSKEAADGLIVTGKEEGHLFHLTGMRSRDQLFNRLVAMDAQFWESR